MQVCHELDLYRIPYRISHRLVRGLDYYTRTTFEVTSPELGAQDSVLGGGRYDGLVKELGGPDVPGIGFALGLERLLLLLSAEGGEPRCQVFLMPLSPAALDAALLVQRDLRRRGLAVLTDYEGRNLKAKMRAADRLGARYAAILGDEEMKKGAWLLRDMQASAQEEVPAGDVAAYLERRLAGEPGVAAR
jgi:histidyl-tRNA synthetase